MALRVPTSNLTKDDKFDLCGKVTKMAAMLVIYNNKCFMTLFLQIFSVKLPALIPHLVKTLFFDQLNDSTVH
jgi:hypothetical protein